MVNVMQMNEKNEVQLKAEAAKEASVKLAQLTSCQRSAILLAMADALLANEESIIAANKVDVSIARAKGVSEAFIDRLSLSHQRVLDMAAGLRQVADLPDPLDQAVRMWRQANGLEIAQVRVPLGVVAIIYEGRPNVTADAIGLCLKSGNAPLLRGSSDAIESNKVIVSVLGAAAYKAGCPQGAIQLIHNTSREAATQLMRLNGLVDVLIPRGGAGLIQAVLKNATVPVIQTGVGICHVYVDKDADLNKATHIIVNAKTQRPSTCNAMETLLVHQDVAQVFLPQISAALREHKVELRGCERTREIVADVGAVDNWTTEYNDLILSIRIMDGVEAAIEHIGRFGSHHSDAIITENYTAARQFAQQVDSAAVYVNASTRFTDGFQFGFGAEIGISTQKLHARGPMGLQELTSSKYIVYGNGQVRS